MAYFISIEKDVFAIVTWNDLVYIIDSTDLRTIKSFTFFMVIMTTAAYTFFITMTPDLRVFLIICILVFAITARVMIVFYSFINQFFSIICWRLAYIRKKLRFLDKRFYSSNIRKKNRPVIWNNRIQVNVNIDFSFQKFYRMWWIRSFSFLRSYSSSFWSLV